MSYRGREIESKLIVKSKSLTKVNNLVESLFESETTDMTMGTSTDTYWAIRNPEVQGDFLRLRELGGVNEITVKGKDKESNLDRIEIDVHSYSAKSKLVKLFNYMLGKKAGTIGKMYYVYFLENTYTTVSVYNILEVEDDFPWILIEVEATSMDRMLELEAKVLSGLADKGIAAERASGSLFEMFILTNRR